MWSPGSPSSHWLTKTCPCSIGPLEWLLCTISSPWETDSNPVCLVRPLASAPSRKRWMKLFLYIILASISTKIIRSTISSLIVSTDNVCCPVYIQRVRRRPVKLKRKLFNRAIEWWTSTWFAQIISIIGENRINRLFFIFMVEVFFSALTRRISASNANYRNLRTESSFTSITNLCLNSRYRRSSKIRSPSTSIFCDSIRLFIGDWSGWAIRPEECCGFTSCSGWSNGRNLCRARWFFIRRGQVSTSRRFPWRSPLVRTWHWTWPFHWDD